MAERKRVKAVEDKGSRIEESINEEWAEVSA